MKPSICLCMIVRNEAPIIRRCLASVKPWITHWHIADTGSVDDTCVIARSELAELPGQLVHHPWLDFGTNRSRALAEARLSGADFVLVIDADEVLHVDDPAVFDALPESAYRLEIRFPNLAYPSVRLMRNKLAWRYEGVLHEYPVCSPAVAEVTIPGNLVHIWTDGNGARGRSGKKSEADLTVLKQAVEDHQDSPRYWFYLAQTYETVGDASSAMTCYRKRTTMGDYVAEVYFSHYRLGVLSMRQGNPFAAARHLLAAYQLQPHRAEPLYYLALMYHNQQEDHVALLYLEQATLLAQPVGDLFVEPDVYHHLAHAQYAVSLYNVGKTSDALAMAQVMLNEDRVPAKHRPVIEQIAGVGK